jgi:hypothetical protein
VLVHRPISPRNDRRLDTKTRTGACWTAVRLKEYIEDEIGWAPYVQAVVALWGEVSGAAQKIDRVIYVRGDKLTNLLLEGQPKLSLKSQREIADAVAGLADAVDAEARTVSAIA